MNGIMNTCFKLKHCPEMEAESIFLLNDLQGQVESLNSGLNQVQFTLLQSDDNLSLLRPCLHSLLFSNKAFQESQQVQLQLQKLTDMH